MITFDFRSNPKARVTGDGVKTRGGHRLARGAALLALAIALLPSATTSETDSGAEVARPGTRVTTPHQQGHQGMRVFLDNEARPTTPTPNSLRALSPRSARAIAPLRPPLKEMTAPGGGRLVQLDGRFQSYSVARIGAGGAVTVDCVGEGFESSLLRKTATTSDSTLLP